MAGWLRRRDRWDAAFGAAAALAAIVILWLGLGLTFFADEWAFIESRSLGDPLTWFTPHNEHWSTLPILVYRALVETVGLGSYLPYLAVVASLHLLVAGFVYALGRRAAGPAVGFGAGLIVLFLGSGFEDLFWGFQIGFVGSTAAGLSAIWVLHAAPTSHRSIAGIGLLIVALMSSGIGVTFIAVVGVELLLDPRRRIVAPLLAIPTLIYIVWYTLYGRFGIATFRNPFTIDALLDAPAAVISGLGNATGAVLGVGPVIGGVVGLITLTIALAWVAIGVRGPKVARFLACMAGLGLQYALIGILRAQISADVTFYTRYTYVSAVLLLVGGTALLGAIWRWDTRTSRRVALLAGGSLLAMALIWNVRLLFEGRDLFAGRAAMTRALVTVGLTRPLPANVDPDRSLILVPSPASLERIVARYGSPLTDRLAPAFVAPIPAAVAAEAERRLIEGAPIFLPGDDSPP